MPEGATAPPPPPPAMPTEDFHVKLPTCLEELDKKYYELDLKKARPGNESKIDWSKAVGFTCSDEGSEGVFFVEFEDGTVISLKGSSTIAADLYALALAHLVGICVPNFRPMRIIDEEFQIMAKKLEELDEKNHPLKRGKHQKLVNRPVILVMEFISGKSLEDMTNPVYAFGSKGEVTPQGAYTLQEIAKINVYDVVINNWDRIPLIWDNEGNAGNILFTKQKNINQIEGADVIALQPVAIDNSVTSIDPETHGEGYEEYLDKVKYVINEVCVYLKIDKLFKKVREEFTITCYEKQPSVMNVAEWIKRVTSFSLKNRRCMDWFMIGFIKAIESFSNMTFDDLEKLQERVAKHVEEALPPEMTADSVALYKVNTQFLSGILKIFKEAAPTLVPHCEKLLEIREEQLVS